MTAFHETVKIPSLQLVVCIPASGHQKMLLNGLHILMNSFPALDSYVTERLHSLIKELPQNQQGRKEFSQYFSWKNIAEPQTSNIQMFLISCPKATVTQFILTFNYWGGGCFPSLLFFNRYIFINLFPLRLCFVRLNKDIIFLLSQDKKISSQTACPCSFFCLIFQH